MSRRLLTAGVAAAVAAAALAGGAALFSRRPAREAPSPDDATMRALLLSKWRVAADGGKVAFCADATVVSQCEAEWEREGGDRTVPTEVPRVAASHAGFGVAWLTVCGTTGTGRRYESEFVATLIGGEVRPMLPVFWGERRYHGVYVEGSEPTRSDQVPSPSPVC